MGTAFIVFIAIILALSVACAALIVALCVASDMLQDRGAHDDLPR